MSLISPLVPSTLFRNDAERRLRRTYIDPLVQSFFRAMGQAVPREVASSKAITEVDFRQSGDLPFSYFYEVVMKGAKKEDGAIEHAAYTLTFDPALCPHTCETTGTQYGYLSLAGRPVLYYILLDLPTLIEKLRQHSDLKPQYGS